MFSRPTRGSGNTSRLPKERRSAFADQNRFGPDYPTNFRSKNPRKRIGHRSYPHRIDPVAGVSSSGSSASRLQSNESAGHVAVVWSGYHNPPRARQIDQLPAGNVRSLRQQKLTGRRSYARLAEFLRRDSGASS